MWTFVSTGREQNTNNLQHRSQSHFAFFWVAACKLVQVSQLNHPPPLALSPLSCQYGCWAVWAAFCSLSIHLQASVKDIYLMCLHRDDKREMTKSPISLTWRVPRYIASLYSSHIFADYCPRLSFHTSICSEILVLVSVRSAILTLFVGSALWFSSLLPAPCFLCLLSRLVTLVLPLNVGSFIITFEHIISIRKNYELNNHKWSCKDFPGYRGYYDVWLVYICLSWVYFKDRYSRSHKVLSDLICVLNLERFLQAVMDEGQMDDKSTSGEGCSCSGMAI